MKVPPGRVRPIKLQQWYLVDFSVPTNPRVDYKPYQTYTRVLYVIEAYLKGDPRWIPIKGYVIVKYGLVRERHLKSLGIRIYPRKNAPKSIERRAKNSQVWPWPDYPKENWVAKLYATFPNRPFIFKPDPNSTAKISTQRNYQRKVHYKKLFKLYETMYTIR